MNEGLGFLAQKILGDAVLAYPLIGLPILAALALVAFANAREARLRNEIKQQRDATVPSTEAVAAPALAPSKKASTIAGNDELKH